MWSRMRRGRRPELPGWRRDPAAPIGEARRRSAPKSMAGNRFRAAASVVGGRQRPGDVEARIPGRLPALMAPAEGIQVSLTARVEDVLPSERLGSLAQLTSEELDDLLVNLSNLERDVSAERRALHDIQDRLQEELVRRYRSGEATVDALLR